MKGPGKIKTRALLFLDRPKRNDSHMIFFSTHVTYRYPGSNVRRRAESESPALPIAQGHYYAHRVMEPRKAIIPPRSEHA